MLRVGNLFVVEKCMWLVVLGRMWKTMLLVDKLLVVKIFIPDCLDEGCRRLASIGTRQKNHCRRHGPSFDHPL